MRMHTTSSNRLDSLEARDLCITRPIFRDVAIIISGQSYNTYSLIYYLAKISVLVILIGENEGLSAPISFDKITGKAEPITLGGMTGVRTDFETAIDFVMFLEQREDTSFGPQPDAVAASTGERGEQLY
ncbi:hypothetical protein NW762_011021 [Fusarium torreyae]|uniref:Uncharacterized protein n=1 Tax=Fusarium torreyae TaxID=1237075 RepID=A0A9W8RTA7_9HYPO|nr:hypothetical protein NW762_011021 [Fusarium torreyae]